MRFGTRKFGGASCEVSVCAALPKKMNKDIREISKLHCDPDSRGKGDATALMKMLCKEADSKKMILVLIVDPFGDDAPLSKAQLHEWYGSTFDFNMIQANPLILARQWNPFPESGLTEKISQIILEAR